MYLQQDKLEEAQSSFEQALELYQAAHSVLGEENSLQKLGKLHLKNGNLTQAEEYLNAALRLHHQSQIPSNVAMDLALLEEITVCKLKSLKLGAGQDTP